MKIKSLTKYSIVGFATSVILTLPCKSASANQPTARFECRGNATVAVAINSGRVTPPLIIWNSRIFRQYPPEERCQIVSDKLNVAYAQNNYEMRTILLTTGRRNGYDVLCVVNNNQTGCLDDGSNQLITLDLSAGNYRNSGDALAALGNRLRNPTLGQIPLSQSGGRSYLSLGDGINEYLSLDGSNNPPIPDTGSSIPSDDPFK